MLAAAVHSVVVWLGLALAPGTAHAAPLDTTLGAYEGQAHELVQRSAKLLRRVQTSDTDYLTDGQALRRYEEGVYRMLVGEHERAADEFFALVTMGSLDDLGMRSDAEWYLAESLFLMGNWLNAAEYYVQILDQSNHPFRSDAVRRVLEIYSMMGDSDKFYEYYDREIVGGRVEPSPQVLYSLAKSFYYQNESERSRAHFAKVEPGTLWYAKAQYWLGAAAVQDGDLEGAIGYFLVAAGTSTETEAGREVVDLAHLALARIQYEQGNLMEAVESYTNVSGNSVHLPDKLYELIWTAIRRQSWDEALDGIDIFLLAYPEHAYVGSLRLTRGQLYMQIAINGEAYRRESAFSEALTTYEGIVRDYEVVRERFGLLAESDASGRGYFRQLMLLEDAKGEELEGLPGYALAMMRQDPELASAIDVARALGQQETHLETSERIVRELTAYLETSTTIASFEKLKLDALETRYGVLDQQVALLGTHEEVLLGGAASERAGEVRQLEPKRQAITARVASLMGRADAARDALLAHERELELARANVLDVLRSVSSHARELESVRAALASSPSLEASLREVLVEDLRYLNDDMIGAQDLLGQMEVQIAGMRPPDLPDRATPQEIATLVEDIASLHERYRGYRVAGRASTGDRIDGVQNVHSLAHEHLFEVESSFADIERSEVGRVRERFESEASNVAFQRVDLNRAYGRAGEVSGTLTKEGLGRLEEFFADSVLKADVGIVDVYWARRLQVSDEIVQLKEERNDLLAELERRLELIRLKAGM
jgi:tetratricopeptide (TPR) repeat protein